MRTILAGGYVLTNDDRAGDLELGEIVINDGLIESVGPLGHSERSPSTRVVDTTEKIVAPGFVDTHRHIWQMPLRGIAADLIAPQYRSSRGRLGSAFEPEDLYVATLAGALEALDSGITTIVDWAHIMNSPEHADASVDALRESGMRAVFTYGTPSDSHVAAWYVDSELRHPVDARRMREEILDDDAALVTMMLGLRAPKAMAEQTMVDDWQFARDLSLRISVDAGLGGGMWGGARDGSIAALSRKGCMGPDTTYVHCNNLTDDELCIIAESGGSVSVSACSEMHVGHGLPATGRLMAAGIRPGLSVDIVSQVGGDMFGTMRATLESERGRLGWLAAQSLQGVDPWTLTTRDVHRFATIDGAATCGLDDRTGSLTPGKQADVIVVGTGRLGMTPVNNPRANLVLAATVGDVDTVFVAGQLVKEHGKLLHPGLDGLRQRVIDARDRIFKRAGLTRGEYMAAEVDPAWIW